MPDIADPSFADYQTHEENSNRADKPNSEAARANYGSAGGCAGEFLLDISSILVTQVVQQVFTEPM